MSAAENVTRVTTQEDRKMWAALYEANRKKLIERFGLPPGWSSDDEREHDEWRRQNLGSDR